MDKADILFERLSRSNFRSRFSLSEQDLKYIDEKGLDTIKDHARDFVRKRLAPAYIPNDGKQTPFRGHPVFKAQHATACCCRGCLSKWHGISAGKELSDKEQEYVVDILMRWIVRQKEMSDKRISGNKKNLEYKNPPVRSEKKTKSVNEEQRQLSIFDLDSKSCGREHFMKFKEHEPGIFGYEDACEFAVVIPIIFNDDEARLLFEVRASSLNDQPGDICFPGGKIEAGENPKEAALREISEELLISGDNIDLIGCGDILYSGSSIIHTFIAELKDYSGAFNEETEEIFTVPYDYFLLNEPEKYYVSRKAVLGDYFPYDRIQGGRNYKWREFKTPVYFYKYKDKNIWGITAAIIKNFVHISELKE